MSKTKTCIDEKTQKNIDSWLLGDYDAETKESIKKMLRENLDELVDSFYTTLSFGTGGLRGIMGIGTNRMNVYNVRMATQGLANYIMKESSKKHSVVVGYDSRKNSREFAIESAKVLAGNGIKVFLYKSLRPVPLISFGVLHKKATAGIMITASHNPPEYNGYKVYWNYGGQVLPPHDQGIVDEISKITANKSVKIVSLPNKFVVEVEDEIDEAYISAIKTFQLNPAFDQKEGGSLRVVYTSLHGSGITMVPPVLKNWGFTNLTLVKDQEAADGSFPSLGKTPPNPEIKEALSHGVELLQKINGDILLATDPDADRLGVVVMHNGKPFFFNGNDICCILSDFICSCLKENNSMPPKATFIKTIVTTELFKKIVEEYGAACIDVLTGFKYIGEKIAQWEEDKRANVAQHHYIFGGEESYGYLIGTHVRDKDAVISSASICEAALHFKKEGKTLVDALYDIYKRFGVFREKLISISFEGKKGSETMNNIMKNLRATPPKILADLPVLIMEDYLTHTRVNISTGEKEIICLPKSDVLRFWLGDNTKIVIRPSGTEPKIKVYCAVEEKHHHADYKSIEKAIFSCDERLSELLLKIKKSFI